METKYQAMRHGVKSLRESGCRAECTPGRTQDERGPPKAMAAAPLFAPEIERTPFRGARKMAALRKGKSAIHVARVYGERKRNFVGRHVWARGYFVSTVGRDERVIRAYIRHQEAEDQRLAQLNLWN